jgi:hypothetical protein
MRPTLRILLTLCLLSATLRADESVPEENENIYDPFYGVPAPLASAFRQFARDANRWAYTQHTVTRGRKGRMGEDSVARYDPSQHYDVQWTLLKSDGKDATESQVKKHRKLRAKLKKNRRTFGELLELERAELIDEAAAESDRLTYSVPVKPEDSRFPVDKVEVLIRVHRELQTLASIELRLRESVRAIAIAKVKSGNAVLHFETVDPAHTPTITRIALDLGASIALLPVEQHTVQTRSEFKRVTPYDDRFTVKPGPLKMIDF